MSCHRLSTSFVTTVGAGVPSVYGSKAKTYCVSLRNLSLRNLPMLPTAWALPTPTCKNHLGRARTHRSHCWSHNSQGSLPLGAVPASRSITASQPLLIFEKKRIGIFSKLFFFTLKSLPYPEPHLSFFQYFCLPSGQGCLWRVIGRIGKREYLVRKRQINCSTRTAISDTLID